MDFNEQFPHLYEKLHEFQSKGYTLKSVDYRYYISLNEQTIELTLQNGDSWVKLRQVRSPYYAGGFSHIETYSY